MFGILSRVSISAVFLYFFQCFLQLFSVLASVSQATARVLNNSMLLFRGTMRLSFFQNVDSSLVFSCSLLQSVVAVAQLKVLALYALFRFRRPMLMLCRSMKSSIATRCGSPKTGSVTRSGGAWREGMRIFTFFLFTNRSFVHLNWPNGPK
ncbi:hypothetical protein VPH35_078671 [Triticum aestivum]